MNGYAPGTRTRLAICEFIVSFRAEHGISPTVREIADGVGRNISTTHHHLETLIEAGLLRRPNIPGLGESAPRTLVPTERLLGELDERG